MEAASCSEKEGQNTDFDCREMSFSPAISSAKAVPAQTDSLNESGNTPSVSFSTNDSLIFRYSFTGSIPKVLIELFQFSLFKPQVVGY